MRNGRKVMTSWLMLTMMLTNVSGCVIRCNKLNDYLCAGDHLITPTFMYRTETLTNLMFSMCHYDIDDGKTYKVTRDDASLKTRNFRPSIAITLTDCSLKSVDSQSLISQNIAKWRTSDCQIDLHLLLVVHDNTFTPLPSIHRNPSYNFQFEKNYNLTLLDEITEIALLKMEEANRSHQMHNNEEFIETHPQDIKSHWPTWALIVVVVCVILSLLAFIIGNYITKRGTPIRNKGQQQNIGKRERKWGAGFSGGLWAAA